MQRAVGDSAAAVIAAVLKYGAYGCLLMIANRAGDIITLSLYKLQLTFVTAATTGEHN